MATSILPIHHHPFHPKFNGRNGMKTQPLIFPRSNVCLSTRMVHQAIQTQMPKVEFSLFQEVTNLCNDGRLHEALVLLQTDSKNSHSALWADAIGALLQACGQKKELEIGRQVHEMLSSSVECCHNVVLNTRLMTMYSMCHSPLDSRHVFDGLVDRNLFQWNALISGYTRNEMWEEAISLFCRLISTTSLTPDNFTLPCVIKACGGLLSVDLGWAVHGFTVKMGLSSDAFVGNALIAMYGKCGFVNEAIQLFEKMSERNLVSWNALIYVFSENGLVEESFDALREMLAVEDLTPDVATVVTVLPVCAGEAELEMGRVVHALSAKLGLTHELTVNNALIDMYAKCGYTFKARHLFENAFQRNVISWNAMIGAYSREGDVYGTFDLLREMTMEGMKANAITVLNALPACLEQSELLSLKELHGYAIRNGFEMYELVANAVITAYARCGSLSYADLFFNGTEIKTVDAWNAIIGGYAQNGDASKAIDLFLEMMSLGLEPDWFSIGSILLACTHLKSLRYGKAIHGFVLRNGLEMDSFIEISLLTLYFRCGKPTMAHIFFNGMEDKNLVSWNSMITGYTQNECPDKALDLFRQMREDGIRPYEIAVVSVLAACAQLSALRLGKETHCFALKANFTDDAFVASTIIDMYAKCGCIELSHRFFDRLRVKDAVHWTVMIAGYGIHGHGHEALELFERMQKEGLRPDGFTFIGVLMACSHAGLVEEGIKYFKEMQRKHEVQPRLEHYACVVDMLGRVGQLVDAARLVAEMPEEPDAGIWGALLAACRIHGEVGLGEKVALKLLELEPGKADNYVLVSNLFARLGRWDDVRLVRGQMKERGLRKDAGCSWIDVEGRIYKFVAGNDTLPDLKEI